MPVSSELGKDIILNWFNTRKDIKTIVDIGCGSGTYPKLLGKGYHWKGVEIYAPYVEKYKLNELYGEIRIGDAQYTEFPKGDCIILGDVLEHMDDMGAIKTFYRADRQFKHVVVSIPMNSPDDRIKPGTVRQCEAENRFEKHDSVWTEMKLDNVIPPTYKIREVEGRIAVFIK